MKLRPSSVVYLGCTEQSLFKKYLKRFWTWRVLGGVEGISDNIWVDVVSPTESEKIFCSGKIG